MRPGDVVFSHSNVGFFGYPEEGRDRIGEVVLGAFQDVLGPSGTLVVPTFTYSFPRMQVFDPQHSSSDCGLFAEYVRLHPEAHRSLDAMLSVAAVGARARELTESVPEECFAVDGFWGRFLRANGLICNLNFDAGSTFIHYVERQIGVTYRYDKLFRGLVREAGRERPGTCVFFARCLSEPHTLPDFVPFDRFVTENGVAQRAPVGRGGVVALRAKSVVEAITRGLQQDAWLLTVSAGGRLALPAPVPVSELEVAPPLTLIRQLEALPRHSVSRGTEVTVRGLARALGLEVATYPSGSRCGSAMVPEAWDCEAATLSGPDGTILADYARDPGCVVPYSRSVQVGLKGSELRPYLELTEPDVTPPLRGWALIHDPALLSDDALYKVSIQSSFYRSAMILARGSLGPPVSPAVTLWIPVDRCSARLLAASLEACRALEGESLMVAVGSSMGQPMVSSSSGPASWILRLESSASTRLGLSGIQDLDAVLQAVMPEALVQKGRAEEMTGPAATLALAEAGLDLDSLVKKVEALARAAIRARADLSPT